MPLEWRAKQQRITATSGSESEVLEWSDAAKSALRLQGLLSCCRMTCPEAVGCVDNDAVRLAVARGSSQKLGHMRKHADVNLQFLRQCGVKVTRVDTTDNVADIFTKIVSAQRLDWHMANFTGAIALKNKHGSITRAKTEVHETGFQLDGLRDVGDPAVVTACPCIKSRLVTMLRATLALRGAAEPTSAVSALTVGGFTEMEFGAAFIAGMIVGMALMYLCRGTAEPAAGNDSELNEGKIYENAGDVSDGLTRDPKSVHANVDISNDSKVGLGTTSDNADPVEIRTQRRARAAQAPRADDDAGWRDRLRCDQRTRDDRALLHTA